MASPRPAAPACRSRTRSSSRTASPSSGSAAPASASSMPAVGPSSSRDSTSPCSPPSCAPTSSTSVDALLPVPVPPGTLLDEFVDGAGLQRALLAVDWPDLLFDI
eukprot:9219443-Alexandrium_andersonii.AAC.1